ncbi:glycosyltransferase family 4 protein [Clostridium drakei]|uniref:Glycosyl transferase n=1 Tax=Clostridium drakei TaxID=332101 RepID=A0A2U8DUF0_9CLOT|nr:glycosyltransferase family 4 protein [Clostridium drakei]AWI06387.1 hypothetical protein B9W14_18410 [Clostridium drakei]
MDKERVLIVHNYYQVSGGEDTVVANEKKMLEDNGHEVFMYTRHNEEIKKSGILEKIKLPFETIYSFKTVREVKKVIRENEIDIVHVHNTLPLISPSVYKAAKDCGCKIVQTVHNFRLLCPGATFTCNGKICEECISKGLKCAIKNKCYRNSKIQTLAVVLMLKINRIIGSYDKVDTYIALTKFNKRKLEALIPKNKIVIKSNFTEKTNLDIIPVKDREYFMFLGRIESIKGIHLLLNTWKEIKDETLVIVGAGTEEGYLREFITNNNISNIEFLGTRKKEDAMKILSKAKALIIPSQWYEGFPMVIIEALSQGVPIIGSNIGNVGGLLKDKTYGIVHDFTNSSIKEVLKSFQNIDKLNMYINNALNEYERKYSVNKNYRMLEKIYKNL